MQKLSVIVFAAMVCVALCIPVPDDDGSSQRGYISSITKTFQDTGSKIADTFESIGSDGKKTVESAVDTFQKEVDSFKNFFNKFDS